MVSRSEAREAAETCITVVSEIYTLMEMVDNAIPHINEECVLQRTTLMAIGLMLKDIMSAMHTVVSTNDVEVFMEIIESNKKIINNHKTEEM